MRIEGQRNTTLKSRTSWLPRQWRYKRLNNIRNDDSPTSTERVGQDISRRIRALLVNWLPNTLFYVYILRVICFIMILFNEKRSFSNMENQSQFPVTSSFVALIRHVSTIVFHTICNSRCQFLTETSLDQSTYLFTYPCFQLQSKPQTRKTKFSLLSFRNYLIILFRDQPFELWDLRSFSLIRRLPKRCPKILALVKRKTRRILRWINKKNSLGLVAEYFIDKKTCWRDESTDFDTFEQQHRIWTRITSIGERIRVKIFVGKSIQFLICFFN